MYSSIHYWYEVGMLISDVEDTVCNVCTAAVASKLRWYGGTVVKPPPYTTRNRGSLYPRCYNRQYVCTATTIIHRVVITYTFYYSRLSTNRYAVLSTIVANPARGQLNRENVSHFPVPVRASENLVMRDRFGRPVPRQTQEGGHTGFLHLASAVLALIFIARRIQPFLSPVDREVEKLKRKWPKSVFFSGPKIYGQIQSYGNGFVLAAWFRQRVYACYYMGYIVDPMLFPSMDPFKFHVDVGEIQK